MLLNAPWSSRSGLLSDIIIYWSPTRNNLLAASKAVMRDAAKFSAPWKQAKLLPNSIDTSVWNPAARQHHRPIERARFGWDESDIIFVFASQGHHRRKGFTLAVQSGSQTSANWKRPSLGYWRHQGYDRNGFNGNWIAMSLIIANLSPSPECSPIPSQHFPLLTLCYFLPIRKHFHWSRSKPPLWASDYTSLHITAAKCFSTPTVNGRLIPWNSAEIATLLRSDYQAGRLIAGNEPVPGVIDPQRFSERLLAILDQESSKSSIPT